MDSVILEKVKDFLAKNESIGIAVGKNPGIDEMAASLSLYLALTENSKKVAVVCPTEPIVEVSSLVGINKVRKSFDGGSAGDLTVSFPYKEGEIEKISYTLEEGKLNILVKAGENGLSFNEKDIEYKRNAGAPGLIFIVGTPRLSDLGTAFDMEVLKDSVVINIDYKPENQGFGDIPLIGQNSSSVSELVASFILSVGFKMNIDIASNLLSGIISATDNFQDQKTSSLSFEMAGILMKKGAVRKVKDGKGVAGRGSFFTSASAPGVAGANAVNAKTRFKTPSFPKVTIGTEENKESVGLDAASAKSFGPLRSEASEPTENNPPDDWLAPKIYKGSTSV